MDSLGNSASDAPSLRYRGYQEVIELLISENRLHTDRTCPLSLKCCISLTIFGSFHRLVFPGKDMLMNISVGKGRKDHEIVQEEAEEKSREEKEAC